MQINIFIPLLFLNLCTFCSSKITSTNTNEQDTYFKPLHTYQKELAKYNRLKKFNQNCTNQEPFKQKNIILLETHFQYKEYLETFFNNAINYYQNQDVVHNKKDLAEKFWQKKHINNVITFKQNYEQYQNDLKNLQSTLEQIKLPDQSNEAYNQVLQELIDEQINPLTQTYKESYEYDENSLFNFKSGNNENFKNIDFEKTIKKISLNFLKTIFCAENDAKKIDFLHQIYEISANKYKPLVNNNTPCQKNIHSLLQLIIYNNTFFSGIFDYYNDTVNKKFPQIIENEVKNNLLNDALQYYRRQIYNEVETTPQQELEKIRHNAMTIISLNVKPIVQNKFKQQYPNNLSSDDISQTITSSIFQKEFEFKDFPTIENLINTIIEHLELPVNQDNIISLIRIFHTNQNDKDMTKLQKSDKSNFTQSTSFFNNKKTPRIVLFSILTLASFWFVVTIFKKLYRFVR